MKKLILITCLSLSAFSFAASKELPSDVERAINRAVSTFSGSERRDSYNWYKDSYFEMIERLDNSGIPQQDKEIIVKRLFSMYGANYPKQLSRVNDEIADYQNLVGRIKSEQKAHEQKIQAENNKSKQEIDELLNSVTISKADLEKMVKDAENEYPADYTLRKAYLKGAIKTYNNLKK